jgi:hypothetical protein
MGRRHQIETELRGQKVTVDFAIVEPDTDAGLTEYGFEDLLITDENDYVVAWVLTDAELEFLWPKVNDVLHRLDSDED